MAGDRREVIPDPGVDWFDDAACRGVPIDEFYSEERGPYGKLGWQDHCPGCPVRAQCLAFALLNQEKWGVWGGFTPVARRRVLSNLLEETVTWVQVARALQPRPRPS
jgi:hypothetical protein